MKEYAILYSVQFKAKVIVEDDCVPGEGEDFGCEIDIPVGGENNSVYVEDSFETNTSIVSIRQLRS